MHLVSCAIPSSAFLEESRGTKWSSRRCSHQYIHKNHRRQHHRHHLHQHQLRLQLSFPCHFMPFLPHQSCRHVDQPSKVCGTPPSSKQLVTSHRGYKNNPVAAGIIKTRSKRCRARGSPPGSCSRQPPAESHVGMLCSSVKGTHRCVLA